MFKSTIFVAPAKINLTLRVLGRLPDGYHQLDTWMHKIQLADTIALEPSSSKTIQLSCPDSDLPEDDSNLVYQAAETFYRLIKQDPSLNIILKKNIPIAAGLGGGSSDCATVLTGLNRLFNNCLSKQTLLTAGKKLGADVPFFIEEFVSARAEGIGEYLSFLPSLPSCYILLVNPGIAVSTGWVFSQLQGQIPVLDQYVGDSQKTAQNSNNALTRESKTYNLGRASAEDGLPDFFNDLEEITLAHYPEIALIKKVLFASDALNVLMSGSGSTVFSIFSDKNQAISCQRNIQSRYPDWQVYLTKPLTVCKEA